MVTEADALARLGRLVSKDTSPTLSAGELAGLLADAQLADAAGATPGAETEWAATTAYSVGDAVVPTLRTGVRWIATGAGTSAGTEPTWPASGAVTDGTVTWEIDTASPAAWAPSYALAAAASEGWRMKAGLVSDRFRFADDGDSYDRQQIFEHCFRMAEQYEKKAQNGELVVGSPAGGAGMAELVLEPTTRRIGLDEDRLIRLKDWDGAGVLPIVNSPWNDSP